MSGFFSSTPSAVPTNHRRAPGLRLCFARYRQHCGPIRVVIHHESIRGYTKTLATVVRRPRVVVWISPGSTHNAHNTAPYCSGRLNLGNCFRHGNNRATCSLPSKVWTWHPSGSPGKTAAFRARPFCLALPSGYLQYGYKGFPGPQRS